MTKKAYKGRLAFDPDTGFHLSDKGEPVCTEDGGKTWHYADDDTPSHFDTYHERFALVDGTANRLAELQLEHGREKAEAMIRKEQPHHFAPTEDDPHFMAGAKGQDGTVTHTSIRFTPDAKSAVATGHTDATGWERSNA